jgi:hypothetical protein
MEFGRAHAGDIRESQPQKIVASIGLALHVSAGNQRVNEIMGGTFWNAEFSAKFGKRKPLL